MINYGEAFSGASFALSEGAKELREKLAQMLDIHDLVSVLLADINLSGSVTDRRFSPDELLRWAGLHSDILPRLKYDNEAALSFYEAPHDHDRQRPFLHPNSAAQVLNRIFVR